MEYVYCAVQADLLNTIRVNFACLWQGNPHHKHEKCSILVFIDMLLLAGQMGETWEPSGNQRTFGNRKATERKILYLFFSFRIYCKRHATVHTISSLTPRKTEFDPSSVYMRIRLLFPANILPHSLILDVQTGQDRKPSKQQ
jgi:hypothetical protein